MVESNHPLGKQLADNRAQILVVSSGQTYDFAMRRVGVGKAIIRRCGFLDHADARQFSAQTLFNVADSSANTAFRPSRR